MPVQDRVQQPAAVSNPIAEGFAAPQDRQSRFGNSFLAEQLAAANATGGAGTDVGPMGSTMLAVQEAPASAPAAPLKIASPAPVQTGRQSRTVMGVQIIGTNSRPARSTPVRRSSDWSSASGPTSRRAWRRPTSRSSSCRATRR